MWLATSRSEPHRKGRCASDGQEPKAAGKAGDDDDPAAGVTATSPLPAAAAGAVAAGAVAAGAAAIS